MSEVSCGNIKEVKKNTKFPELNEILKKEHCDILTFLPILKDFINIRCILTLL